MLGEWREMNPEFPDMGWFAMNELLNYKNNNIWELIKISHFFIAHTTAV